MGSARRSLLPGIILIAVGLIFLLQKFGCFYFTWDTIWPIFLVIPGLAMIIGSFRKGAAGTIFPGVVIFLIGILFFAVNYDFFWYYNFEELWPLFIVIVGIAFIALFLRKPSGMKGLIPGIFLIGLGSIFLLNEFGYLSWYIWEDIVDFWPVLIILIGLNMIFRNFIKSKSSKNDPVNQPVNDPVNQPVNDPGKKPENDNDSQIMQP